MWEWPLRRCSVGWGGADGAGGALLALVCLLLRRLAARGPGGTVAGRRGGGLLHRAKILDAKCQTRIKYTNKSGQRRNGATFNKSRNSK